MKMLEPHQQRVVTEKEELDEKISKLSAFLETDMFSKLKHKDAELLSKQIIIMSKYSTILKERIDEFSIELN